MQLYNLYSCSCEVLHYNELWLLLYYVSRQVCTWNLVLALVLRVVNGCEPEQLNHLRSGSPLEVQSGLPTTWPRTGFPRVPRSQSCSATRNAWGYGQNFLFFRRMILPYQIVCDSMNTRSNNDNRIYDNICVSVTLFIYIYIYMHTCIIMRLRI